MCVALLGREGTLLIANIHIVPEESNTRKIALMRHINAHMYNSDFSHNVLCGDLNITAADEGVYNFANKCHTYNTRTLSQAWNDIFKQYTDISSGDFTHRTRSAEGRLVNASRVDRVFSSLAPALLMDKEPKCGAMFLITDESVPSDHVPYFVKFCKNTDPPACATIATWIPGHFSFLGAFEEVLTEWEYNEEMDIFERRETIHAAFHKAAGLVKDRCKIVANTSPSDQTLAITLAAMRAYHSKQGRKLERAINSFPQLQTYFHPSDTDPSCPFHLAHPNHFMNSLIRSPIRLLMKSTPKMRSAKNLTSWKRKGARQP